VNIKLFKYSADHKINLQCMIKMRTHSSAKEHAQQHNTRFIVKICVSSSVNIQWHHQKSNEWHWSYRCDILLSIVTRV